MVKIVDREIGNIEVTIYDMLNELKAYKNLDVYVTGSNSKGLSKDVATEFRKKPQNGMMLRAKLILIIQTNIIIQILAFAMPG